MLVLQRIVSPEELVDLCRDLTYTRVEIRPNTMKGFRDVKVKCFLKYNETELFSLKGMLKAQSNNPKLSHEVREKIGGFYGNFETSTHMKLSLFNQMRAFEKKYDISFGIPKKYNVYIENIETDAPDRN